MLTKFTSALLMGLMTADSALARQEVFAKCELKYGSSQTRKARGRILLQQSDDGSQIMIEGYFYSMEDDVEHAISITTNQVASSFSSCDDATTGTGALYAPGNPSNGLRIIQADNRGR